MCLYHRGSHRCRTAEQEIHPSHHSLPPAPAPAWFQDRLTELAVATGLCLFFVGMLHHISTLVHLVLFFVRNWWHSALGLCAAFSLLLFVPEIFVPVFNLLGWQVAQPLCFFFSPSWLSVITSDWVLIAVHAIPSLIIGCFLFASRRFRQWFLQRNYTKLVVELAIALVFRCLV
ncbi:hypothetical protein C8F04DRAFT_515391 [Mycena alexandri]|uniref:Uncharacterized protein n=1 Tax=Mycena alexandri TaxID=1745969 RepID=A0AAD6SXL4_9AGAR|nr:hypothetical protein C8F04DRAFT_515391 [Mycena alexandri]